MTVLLQMFVGALVALVMVEAFRALIVLVGDYMWGDE
jgi:hypothetical protein